MALSGLQRFILTEAYGSRSPRVPSRAFDAFYRRRSATAAEREGAVTRSLERLIDRGYLVGYGRRTPEKWFIEDVRLTAFGRRVARRLLGEQQQIPLPKFKRPRV